MKKSELRRLIKEELLKESYESKELEKTLKTHDWNYKMNVIFINSEGKKTKTLSISKEMFNDIYKLF